MAAIEEELDVHVCLLNRNGFQIPGKIFYHTDTDQFILIVLDGLFAAEIKAYLERFDRFIFCENNEESIRSAIRKICKEQVRVDLSKVKNLSPVRISNEIIRYEGSFEQP